MFSPFRATEDNVDQKLKINFHKNFYSSHVSHTKVMSMVLEELQVTRILVEPVMSTHLLCVPPAETDLFEVAQDVGGTAGT